MSLCLCTGGMLQCSFGLAPAIFSALPVSRVTAGGFPVGTMTDMAPAVNVPSFGMCRSPSNPAVALATAAALGALTPMPCVPAPAEPWTSAAPKVSVGGQSVLTQDSKLVCAWGGQITVRSAGQTGVTVD